MGLIVLAGLLVLSLAVGVAGALGLLFGVMRLMRARTTMMLVVLAAIAPTVWATPPNPADRSIERFLSRRDQPHAYRATRRLEAENGTRHGWLDAKTEYSPERGFRYQITAEGGSSQIRDRVLKAVLEGERTVIAQGEDARSALAPNNYTFEPKGVDVEGLANVLVSPRRKERALLSGVMFLRPDEGELVRLHSAISSSWEMPGSRSVSLDGTASPSPTNVPAAARTTSSCRTRRGLDRPSAFSTRSSARAASARCGRPHARASGGLSVSAWLSAQP